MFRDYTLRSHDRDIYNLTRVRKVRSGRSGRFFMLTNTLEQILLTLIMLLSFINVVLVVSQPQPVESHFFRD